MVLSPASLFSFTALAPPSLTALCSAPYQAWEDAEEQFGVQQVHKKGDPFLGHLSSCSCCHAQRGSARRIYAVCIGWCTPQIGKTKGSLRQALKCLPPAVRCPANFYQWEISRLVGQQIWIMTLLTHLTCQPVVQELQLPWKWWTSIFFPHTWDGKKANSDVSVHFLHKWVKIHPLYGLTMQSTFTQYMTFQLTPPILLTKLV